MAGEHGSYYYYYYTTTARVYIVVDFRIFTSIHVYTRHNNGLVNTYNIISARSRIV